MLFTDLKQSAYNPKLVTIPLNKIKSGKPSCYAAFRLLKQAVTREMGEIALQEQTYAAAVECIEIAKLMMTAWFFLSSKFKRYEEAIVYMESAEKALKKLISKQRTRRFMVLKEKREAEKEKNR